MSRIDQLIAEHCPDGVEFRKLGTLGKRNKGTSITAGQMREIQSPTGAIRVFAAGSTVVDVEEQNIPAKDVVWTGGIVVKSRGNIGFENYSGPFTHKSELWSYSINSDEVSEKFVYYFLLTQQDQLQALARSKSVKLPQLSVGDTDNLLVPIPPINIQREIVQILDAMTSLQAELQAELAARRSQFEFYRDSLLNFNTPGTPPVRWMTLGEIADLNWGDTKTTKSAYVTEGEKYLAFSAAGPDGFLDHFDYDRQAVVLSAIGALAGKTWLASGKWSCIKNTIRFFSRDENVVRTEFLYWYTSTPNFWPRRGSAQPFISKGDADKIQIPLPTVEMQDSINYILGKFESLISDISFGLPAEIEARRKQYEYYRDKLLTFKELAA